ncbi:MAG: M3 family metallopeptidase [Fuerstiella sp.]|nr:M3 family metallopeptidase [Fuerstiella sp.]
MALEHSDNPILRTSGIPSYDAIQPGHVESGITEMLRRAEQLLTSLEKQPARGWDSLMNPLEKIDLLYEYGWNAVGHLLSVVNSDELRQAHETVLPAVVEFGLRIAQSQPLYQQMCCLRDGDTWNELSACRQRIITLAIQNAELSGIGLDPRDKNEFNRSQKRLSQLGSDFANHVLDSIKAFHRDLTESEDAEGLPDSFRRMAAAAWSQAAENKGQEATPESGPWRITLDAPSFGPFMEHCRNRDLREIVYRAWISRASDGELNNEPLIAEILKLRNLQAKLLGFNNYAELSLSRKMAGTVDRVDAMFQQLLTKSLEKGQQELDEITRYANGHGHEGPLAHWDLPFWAERLREERFAFTDEELRPYFSLDRVLSGLFDLCERLFGISVVRTDKKAPRWHDDVRYYEIRNEKSEYIAAFYLDPYSRPENKRGGAWMNDCITRSVTPSQARLPIAHLICNGTPPVGNVPSLMTFREVETLFHEFGHGLQHMLTVIDDRDAAGISGVEWDAVELPSQFMENWCYHRPTLLGMAVHHESGETLPEELFERICAARTYRAATAMLRQLLFGMTDIELHSSFDPDGSETAFDVFQKISEATSSMPVLPENRFLCSFQHIFSGGYSAGYYSYKWAEVLSADAFGAFEDAGLDDETAVAETGRRFRDTVLAQGGSRHPMDIFREFRGREPTVDALLRHCGLTK